ncbi:MAG: hydrolase [Candidatus Marsarchaeota archaeon]|nr:hydrolase [Candidatus Marsarchaeota archaeon]MCL5413463.1 hydrolase [Candidatus Marsarchaeota archaeon]
MAENVNIDRKKTALVVIDLQKGIATMGRPLAPHSVDTVVKNAASLADAFRKNGMPVFLVHVIASEKDRLNVIVDENPWTSQAQAPRPADWTDFVPDLGPKESDILITKKQWGAFYGTDLELLLRRRGIDTIVLCGIATNYGVESTARFAYEYGFHQIFAEDAITSMTKEMHDASVNYVLKRVGRVRNTDEILENLK